MDSPYSSEDELEDNIDFLCFKSLVPDVKVKLPELPFHEDVDKSVKKSFFSQLVCSSKYGYFIAASKEGFICGQTGHVYDCIYSKKKAETASIEQYISVKVKEGGVKFLALSKDELQLIIGTSQHMLLIYNVADVVKDSENALPVQTVALNSEIISVDSNPDTHPDLVAVCVVDKKCLVIQLSTGQILQTISDALVASWSPKGERIACSNQEGTINIFDSTDKVLYSIAAPEDLEDNTETDTFLVVYGNAEKPDADHFAYIVHNNNKDKYQKLDDVTPIYTDYSCDNQFYMSVIRGFGSEVKTMVVVANAVSNELGVIGQDEKGEWNTWKFEENQLPFLPLSDDGMADTYPVGTTIDFSSSKELPPFDFSENDTPVPPMPIFLLLTNEGRICAYHIYNKTMAKSGDKYSGMVNALDVFSIPAPTSNTPVNMSSTNSSDTSTSEIPKSDVVPSDLSLIDGSYNESLKNTATTSPKEQPFDLNSVDNDNEESKETQLHEASNSKFDKPNQIQEKEHEYRGKYANMDENDNKRPVEDIVFVSKLESQISGITRFATLPPKSKTTTPYVLTATHPLAKNFERIYFETEELITNTHNLLSDVHQDLTFHQPTDLLLKGDEYLSDESYEWKRGDTYSVGSIVDRLIARMPAVKTAIRSFDATLKQMEPSVDILVEHADKLNKMNIRDLSGKENLEELKQMGINVQYKELLKTMKAKKESIESLIAATEHQVEELKKQSELASNPNEPQEKLTTYVLRRNIRNHMLRIRNAEIKIDKVEKILQEKNPKISLNDDSVSMKDEKPVSITKKEDRPNEIEAESFISKRLYRQVLLYDLFSFSQERDPLHTIPS
ncbi:hypothetical protein BY458DRAFT_560966 [Sporodiniella umbellata]|nr:hypothetical protein BY458DRAFT_560966 [Sporodiniella umbellata]